MECLFLTGVDGMRNRAKYRAILMLGENQLGAAKDGGLVHLSAEPQILIHIHYKDIE